KQQTDKPKKMVYVGPEPEKPKKKKRGGCSTSLFVIAIVLFAVYIFDSDDDDRNTTRPEPTVSFSSQQSTSRPNQTLVPTILLTNTPLATELALEITPTINLDATRRAEQNFIILTQMASAPTRTPIPPTRRPTEAPSEFWYTASNANARSCPNRDCDVVTVIETGTRIEVV